MKKLRKMLLFMVVLLGFTMVIPAQESAAVKISKKSVVLIKGQTTVLKITGTTHKATWSSNKKSIANVSATGKVAAKAKGIATITAKIGSKKYTCKVTVQDPIISKKTLLLYVDGSSSLKLSGTNQKVSWKSSNTKIATVNSKGKITAKKAGKVNITATVLKKKYTCKVTVKAPSLSRKTVLLTVGESITLKMLGTKQKVTWKTSNSKVATVKNGKVTGKGAGTATITATVEKKKYTCKVTVKALSEQEKILQNISKSFVTGSYYGSEWSKVLICTFKNNSGYDLDFGMSITFTAGGDPYASAWEEQYYFKNGTELVMITGGSWLNRGFDSYDIKYTVKKATPQNIYINNKVTVTTSIGEYGAVNWNLSDESNVGYYWDGLVVYYNSAGQIIDFATDNLSGHGSWSGKFNLPVNANLNTVAYASYKIFNNISG